MLNALVFICLGNKCEYFFLKSGKKWKIIDLKFLNDETIMIERAAKHEYYNFEKL